MIKHGNSKSTGSMVNAPAVADHQTATEGIHQDKPVTDLTSVHDMTNFVIASDKSLELRDPLIAADKFTYSKELPSFIKYLDTNTFLFIYTTDFDKYGWAYITKMQIVSRKDEKGPVVTRTFKLRYVEDTGTDEYTYPEHPASVIKFEEDVNLKETLAIHKTSQFNIIDGEIQITGISLTIKNDKSDLFSGVTGHPLYRATQFNVEDEDFKDLKLNQGMKIFANFYRTSEGSETYELLLRLPEVTTLTGDVNKAVNAEFNLALQNPYAIADLYNYGANSVTQILAYALDRKVSIDPAKEVEYLKVEISDLNYMSAIFNVQVQVHNDIKEVIISTRQNFSFIDLTQAWGNTSYKETKVPIAELQDNILRYFEVSVNGTKITEKDGDKDVPIVGILPLTSRAGDILFKCAIPTAISTQDLTISLVFKTKTYDYIKHSVQEEDTEKPRVYLYENNWGRDYSFYKAKKSDKPYYLTDFSRSFTTTNGYVRPIGLEEYGLYISYLPSIDKFVLKNYSLLDSEEYYLFHRYAYKFFKYDEVNIKYPNMPYKDIPYLDTMQIFCTQATDPQPEDYVQSTYLNTYFELDIEKKRLVFNIKYYVDETLTKTDKILNTEVEKVFAPYIMRETDTSSKIISSIPDNFKSLNLLKAFTTSSKSNHVFCNWEISDRDIESWSTLEEFISKNRGVLPFYTISVPDNTGESKESLEDAGQYYLTKTVVPLNANSGTDLIKNRPDVQTLFNTSLSKKFKFNIYFYKDNKNLSDFTDIMTPVPFICHGFPSLTNINSGTSIYANNLAYTVNNTYSSTETHLVLGAALSPYFSNRAGQDIFSYYKTIKYKITIAIYDNTVQRNPTPLITYDPKEDCTLLFEALNNYLVQSAMFVDKDGQPITIDLLTLLFGDSKLTPNISTTYKIDFKIEYTDKADDGTFKETTTHCYYIYNYYSAKKQLILDYSGYTSDLMETFNHAYNKDHLVPDRPLVLNTNSMTGSNNSLKIEIAHGEDVEHPKVYKLLEEAGSADEFYKNIGQEWPTTKVINSDIEDAILLFGYAILNTPTPLYYDNTGILSAVCGSASGDKFFYPPYHQLTNEERNQRNITQIVQGYLGGGGSPHDYDVLARYSGIIPRCISPDCQVGHVSPSRVNCGWSESGYYTSNNNSLDIQHILQMEIHEGYLEHWQAYEVSLKKAYWTNIAANSNYLDRADFPQCLVDAFKNNHEAASINPRDYSKDQSGNSIAPWLPTNTSKYPDGATYYNGIRVWRYVVDKLIECKTSSTVEDTSGLFPQFFVDLMKTNPKKAYEIAYSWGYNLYYKKYKSLYDSNGKVTYIDVNESRLNLFRLDYTVSTTVVNSSKRSQLAYIGMFNNADPDLGAFLSRVGLQLDNIAKQTYEIRLNNTTVLSKDTASFKVEVSGTPYSGRTIPVSDSGFSEDNPCVYLNSGENSLYIHFHIEFLQTANDPDPYINSPFTIAKIITSAYTPYVVIFSTSNNLVVQHIPYSKADPEHDLWQSMNKHADDKYGDVDPRLSRSSGENISSKYWAYSPIYLPDKNAYREIYYATDILGEKIPNSNHGPLNYWLDPILGSDILTSHAILVSSKEYIFDNSTKTLVTLNSNDQPELLAYNQVQESLSTSKYLQNRFWIWGVLNYENQVFYSKAGSYEFPALNVLKFTGNVTQIIEWREYILVFTTQCIYLLTYDINSDTYGSKLIHQNEGVPKEFARTIKTILNGIIFRGYSGQVYKLIPNQYSSSDNILNIKLLSHGVEDLLQSDVYYYESIKEDKRVNCFAFSDSEHYRIFIQHPKPERPLPGAIGTTCFTFNYVDNTWTKQTYPIYATSVVEIEGVPYLVCDNNKHYEFYKTHLWLQDYPEYNMSNLKYGDYLTTVRNEITVESPCLPIQFSIDFGQKSPNYAVYKQFIESRFSLINLSEKDLFPFNIDVYTDGMKRVIHVDPNTNSSLIKKQESDILSLSRNANRVTLDDHTTGIMRQYIIKYSGQGKTVQHILHGESSHPFKFYSLDVLNRTLPKK